MKTTYWYIRGILVFFCVSMLLLSCSTLRKAGYTIIGQGETYYYREAEKSAQNKEWDKAIELYEKAIAKAPQPRELYYPYAYAGLAYLAVGDVAAAQESCEAAQTKGIAPKELIDTCLKAVEQRIKQIATPTPEPTEPTATPAPEPTATPTPEPTATPIPEPTATPTPEPTATPTSEPTATMTPEPTVTPTPEPTFTTEPTATPTPEPTMTPTPEPTATPTPEPTMTPTPEPTRTPTPEPTVTPTPEPTATPTSEPTVTPTPEPTFTSEPTVTPTPESTATATPEPTATPTPEPTATPTPGPTATPTPEPTVTPEVPEPVATAVPEPIASEPTQLSKRPRNIYATIIGIGDFEDSRIPSLRFTTNDARGFYEVLTDPHVGGVPEEHVKLLLNEEATSQNIKSAVGTWLKRQAGENDMVIIYYAGHGATEGQETYWVTYEANIDDLYATALNNNTIADMLERIEARRMITFLDSCYSAATVNRENQTRDFAVEIPWDKFSGEGNVTISASNGKQLSLELAGYKHGVFTYYLLEGLKGEADGAAGKEHDGIVELDEVWNYVKNNVTETARKQGNTQTPVFQGTVTAGIPLTYNLDTLKKLKQQQAQEIEQKQAQLQQLFEEEKIQASKFDCAFQMLESGESNGYIDGLLSGEISPETFDRIFECNAQ